MSSSIARRLAFVLLLVLIVGVEGVALFANLPTASSSHESGIWALVSSVTSMRESPSLILLGAFLILAASQLRRRLVAARSSAK